MKIESLDQDVRTLLSSGYYRIPRFQRPYSWTRENLQDFWDDIVRDNPTDYFIGSMVVFKDGSQRFGVVDGQQRLTTITLLLAVLRNTLGKLGFDDLAGGIHGLIERKNIDNRAEFILSTETAYPFLQDHILKWGSPELPVTPMHEEENLRSAFDHLEHLVDGVVQSQELDTSLPPETKREGIAEKLVAIRDALLNLKVIFVKLDDEDDAYIIFETLNTRGKDLSLTDLVKNHMAKHLKTKSASVDQTKVKWQRMLEIIEGSSSALETDAFIHHFWLSRYDYLPAKSLFKTLKRRVTRSEAKSFLDALISDAVLYRTIHEVTYGKWSKQEKRIADSLSALQLFRVQQQTPCVLSLMRAYKAKHIKMRHLEDALVAIEKFHFLFTAVTSQRSSGGISAMYASLGRRLFKSTEQTSALAIIRDLKEKLRERVPLKDEVRAQFPQITYTDNVTRQKNLVKYILAAFYKATTPGVSVDYEGMTIEHLVPQSQIDTNGFNDWNVGQIGNLILVSGNLNTKLSNKPFREKKRILQAQGYLLAQEVSSADEWTVEHIEKMTNAMADRAYDKVWKI